MQPLTFRRLTGRSRAVMLACLCLLVLAAPASADIRYTSRMVPSTGGGAPSFEMRTTTLVKGERERVEMTVDMGLMKITHVTIKQCDLHRTLRVDPELGIYAVMPMSPVPASLEGMRSMTVQGHKKRTPGQGVVTVTYSVQDLGTEKVAGLDTKHTMLGMRIQESGCAGSDDRSFKMELWTANIPTFNCHLAAKDPGKSDPDEDPCKIRFEMRGDVQKSTLIQGQLPARMKIYDKDRVMMVQELVDYSQAPLSDALFDVPAGARKVSEAEFNTAQQQKMMRQIPTQPPSGE